MNWDAIGATGEMLGAVTVLVTLIYLALQVRQNVKLTKASIRESRSSSSQRILLAFREEAELIFKDGERSKAENYRLEMTYRTLFRDWEAYAYQYHQGLLDKSEWEAIMEAQRWALSHKFSRSVWEKAKPAYSKLLRDQLDSILNNMES